MAWDFTLRGLTASERDAACVLAQKQSQDLGGLSLDEFRQCYASGRVGGLIAHRGKRLGGFLLFVMDAKEAAVRLVTVGVVHEQRRRGIGSALLTQLDQEMQAAGPGRNDALGGERDLQTQRFRRANGFRAVRVRPAAFAGGADDGYCFGRVVLPAGSATPVRTARRRRSNHSAE